MVFYSPRFCDATRCRWNNSGVSRVGSSRAARAPLSACWVRIWAKQSIALALSSTVLVLRWSCAGTSRMLDWCCTGTVRILHEYCAGTEPVLHRYCTGTALVLC